MFCTIREGHVHIRKKKYFILDRALSKRVKGELVQTWRNTSMEKARKPSHGR